MRPNNRHAQTSPYEDFDKALAKLREISALPEDDVIRDALLKRFALAYETAWRVIRRELQCAGIASPSAAGLSDAVDAKLITDTDTWMELYRQRKRTERAFEDAEACAIARFARLEALPSFEALLERLREERSGD